MGPYSCIINTAGSITYDDIFSNENEGITLTEVVKNNAFTAVTPCETRIPCDMFAYKANIPEPSLMGLAMIGILLMGTTHSS